MNYLAALGSVTAWRQTFYCMNTLYLIVMCVLCYHFCTYIDHINHTVLIVYRHALYICSLIDIFHYSSLFQFSTLRINFSQCWIAENITTSLFVACFIICVYAYAMKSKISDELGFVITTVFGALQVAQLGDGEQSQHRLAESKYIKNSS